MANDINLTNVVLGDNGNDALEGIQGGQNRLYGYDGDDLLLGASDADVLAGGDGDDVLAGGPGLSEDWFEIDRHDGRDVVTDFTPADRILLHDGIPPDIQRVIDAATIETGGGGTTLHYGDTEIVLLGVPISDLSPDWFVVI
jgi:Ca2+-binding RTX toxin-like protein